jgi:DNA polymerase-3 subunit epsilon
MTKYRPIYYDTETTGVKSSSDKIIEIAAYDPNNDRTFCSFVNPGCSIPAEASAISHITDEMVKDAPSFKDVAPEFMNFCSGDVVLIAHNNDAFDQLFLEAEFARGGLPFPAWKFLDSLKWSRKYRNDLPRHGLQFLREVYGVVANQAHRALDDVMVLATIFSSMIGDLPIDTVMTLLASNHSIVRMPFGKHGGKLLAEVPKDYVRWLADNGALEKKENSSLKAEFVKLGYIE